MIRKMVDLEEVLEKCRKLDLIIAAAKNQTSIINGDKCLVIKSFGDPNKGQVLYFNRATKKYIVVDDFDAFCARKEKRKINPREFEDYEEAWKYAWNHADFDWD